MQGADTWFNALDEELKDQRYKDAKVAIINAEYFTALAPVVSLLTEDWLDAYRLCCCAVKPYYYSLCTD